MIVNEFTNIKGLKIISWNVQSLFNKIDMIKHYILSIKPDIVLICETWLNEALDNAIVQVPDYTIVRQDRSTRRGGGLLFYVNNLLVVNSDFPESPVNYITGDFETLLISLHLKESLPIYIVGLYRPPSGRTEEYIKKCESIVERIYLLPKGKKAEIMFLGDDLSLNNKCSIVSKVNKFCNKFSLKQLVKEPTRISRTSTLIDHFYTNSHNILFCSPLQINVSDHLPFAIVRKKKCSIHTGRSYFNYTKDAFSVSLVTHDWDLFYSLTDTNKLWQLMLKYITTSLNELAPVRKFKFRNERPIWFSDELMEIIKDKDTLTQRATRTKDEEDRRIAWQARNRANQVVREAKASYIKEQFNILRHSPKKFWQNVKNVLPDSDAGNRVKLSLKDRPSLSDEDTAVYINNYFVNVGKKLVHQLNAPPSVCDPDLNDQHNGFGFQPIVKAELNKLIANISVYKSSGVDNISSRALKDAFDVLIDQLLYIMNQSILSSTFPDAWKLATVIPLPKVNNPSGVSDYRPISLLPLPGKLLEKLLHGQLIKYLEDNKLLNKKQNGFRKDHNTNDTVFKLVYGLTNQINVKNPTSAVFVDFAKAFDTIDHIKMLNKLKLFTVHSTLIKWMKSYLISRKQRVMVNNKYSDCETVEYGVPQGSILGLYYLFCIRMI